MIDKTKEYAGVLKFFFFFSTLRGERHPDTTAGLKHFSAQVKVLSKWKALLIFSKAGGYAFKHHFTHLV